jgi:tetratricopeptide (TPR) repeat protein
LKIADLSGISILQCAIFNLQFLALFSMLELSQTRPQKKLSNSLLRIAATSLTITALVGAAAWYLWPIYDQKTRLWGAENAFQSGNLEKADELLLVYTRVYRNDSAGHLLYGRVLHGLGKYMEADGELGRALDTGMPKEKVRRAFGLLWSTYDFDKARAALREELLANPNDGEVLQALAFGTAESAQWEESEGYFRRWIEMEPDNVEPLLERGRVYMEAEDFRKASADFREVLKRKPDNFRARVSLGHCLLGDARPREAEAELLICKDLRPDSAEPLIDLAACALERLDYEKANTLLTKALQLDTGSREALSDLGNLQLLRKRYDLAASTFREVLRKHPTDKQAHLKLAQALRFMGNQDEAGMHEEIYGKLDAEEEHRTRKGTRRR